MSMESSNESYSDAQKVKQSPQPLTQMASLNAREKKDRPESNVSKENNNSSITSNETKPESKSDGAQDLTPSPQPKEEISKDLKKDIKVPEGSASPHSTAEELRPAVVTPNEPEKFSQADSKREEMIEQYYQYQKEKRDLRRRNLQSQTNIAQFFRKHKFNPFPADPEKSQAAQRDEYNKLLLRIEALAADKEKEMNSFNEQMKGIMERTKGLKEEIASTNKTLNDMRYSAAKNSIHMTTGKTLSAKDVGDHITALEGVTNKMQPVRLEYAKFKRRHDKVLESWNKMVLEKDKGIDSVEIALENQVFNEKAEQRQQELRQLQDKTQIDVIMLAHIKVKYEEIVHLTEQTEQEVNSLLEKRKKLKQEVFSKKSELFNLTMEKRSLEKDLGILLKDDLLQDFLETKEKVQDSNSCRISE